MLTTYVILSELFLCFRFELNFCDLFQKNLPKVTAPGKLIYVDDGASICMHEHNNILTMIIRHPFSSCFVH